MSVNCNQTKPTMKYSKFEETIDHINNGVFTPDAACLILTTLQKDLELCADYQLFVSVENILKKLIEAFGKNSHLSNLINVFVTKLKREDSVYYSMEDSENVFYNIEVLKIIARNHSDDNLLFEAFQKLNRTQLLKAMILNSKDGPTEICFKFVHSKLIPEILSQNMNYDSNKEIIDFIFALPMGFAHQHMNEKQIQDFKREVINRYLPHLNQADLLSSNWWIYCKLLIYYCGKILHSEKDMTNAILRLVEHGFKSRGTTDKLGCFECWKILIENYYLDQRYLKNHLRLLLQPLKLKFGWSIEIFEARFECYLSLLEKLENSSHMCVEEYLNAVLMPFSEEDANNIRVLTPGQHLKDIFTKATEVLLKLLGHDRETCCKNKDIYLTNIYKIEPYLNWTLLNVHTELFVNSVRICSEMTLLWSHGKDREIVINCLWTSLFNLIQYSGNEGKEKATLRVVRQNFQIILEKCLRNEKYYDVLKTIIKSFTNFLDKGTVTMDEFIYKELLLDMVIDISKLQSNNNFTYATTREILKNLLDCCKQELSFIDDIQTNFLHNKCDYLYSKPVIMYTAKNISTILNHTDSTQEKRKFVKNLLDWCLENNLPSVWESILKNGCVLAISDMKMELVNVLKVAAQQDIVYLPIILKICTMYLKILFKKDGLVFAGLIDVIMVCYSKEKLERQIKSNIAETLKIVVESKKQHDFEVNLNFYQCFENVLTLHKAYEVLVVLSDFMESVKTNKNLNFPKSLENIVNSFTLNSDMEYKKSAQKIMIKLENLNNRNPVLTSMSRAAKITSLANENLKSNNLSLFGTHLKPNSPLRFKGHQVERDLSKYFSPKNGNNLSPKTKKSINLLDLDEKDFVVIDKKVEVVVSKLNDHQIQRTQKRRDDIPALYQDLTQSSMDMTQNNENVLNASSEFDKVNKVNIEPEKTSDLDKKNKTENTEMVPKSETNILNVKPILSEDAIINGGTQISDIIRKATTNTLKTNGIEETESDYNFRLSPTSQPPLSRQTAMDYRKGNKSKLRLNARRKKIKTLLEVNRLRRLGIPYTTKNISPATPVNNPEPSNIEGLKKRKQTPENIRKDENDENNKTNSEMELPDSSSNGNRNTDSTNLLETPRKRRGRRTNSERERIKVLQEELAEKEEKPGPLTKAAQRALHHLRLDIVGAEEFRKELPKRIVKKKNNENFLSSLPSRRTERSASLANDKQNEVTSKQPKARTKVKVDPLTETELRISDSSNKDVMPYLTQNNNGIENDLNNTPTLVNTETTTIHNSGKIPDTDTLYMFSEESCISNKNSNTITQSLSEESKSPKVSDMDTESLSFTNSPTNFCDSLNKTNKISEMDTKSISITSDNQVTNNFEQVFKFTEDLPVKDRDNFQRSPVANETPTRKKELLSSTSDISSIKLDLNTSMLIPQKRSSDVFSEGSKKRKQIFEGIRKDENDEDNKTNSEIELPDSFSNSSGKNTNSTNSLETPRKRRGRRANSEREQKKMQIQQIEKKEKADDKTRPLSKASPKKYLKLDIVDAEQFHKDLPKRIVKSRSNENLITYSRSKLATHKQIDVTSKQLNAKTELKVDPLAETEVQSDPSCKNTLSCLTENNNGVESDLTNPTDLGTTNNNLIEGKTIHNCRNIPDTETLDMFSDECISNKNSQTITQSFREESKSPKVSEMDTESLSFINSPTNICDSLNRISEMDTETLNITSDITTNNFEQGQKSMEGSPSTDKNNLQCSPVTNETPTRKKELLNNTSDISPIKLELNTTISTPRKKSPDIFSEEDGDLNLFEIEANLIEIKPRTDTEYKNSLRVLSFPPKTAKCIEFPNLSSPKTDRIKKMMLNCNQTGIGSEIKDETDFIKMNNSILKFDREVPSPLATPKASILKRKAPDDPYFGGLSPCPKRKRVNFSDPPTTCEKIYFKEVEENSNFRKLKKKSLNNLINQKNNLTEKSTLTVDIEKPISGTIPFPLEVTENGVSPVIDNTLNSSSEKNNDTTVTSGFNWTDMEKDTKCGEMDDDLSGISIHLTNETLENDSSHFEEIPTVVHEKKENVEEIPKMENVVDFENKVNPEKKCVEMPNVYVPPVVLSSMFKTLSETVSKEHYCLLLANCVQQSVCFTTEEKEGILDSIRNTY